LATIEDLYNAFKQVDLRRELPVLIVNTKTQIQIKVTNQMDKGELSTGYKIAPTYGSDYYAGIKNKLNPTPGYGTPDIRLTGDLYNEIDITANEDEYDIESNVPYAKSPSILKYGDNLLRMSEDSKQEYCDETLGPAIQSYITEKTGLTFN
jgi:hypothetical protein